MDDLVLASEVKAALVDAYPGISVKSDYGNIVVYTKHDARQVRKLEEKVESLKEEIQGIKYLEVHPGGIVPPDAV